MPPASDTALVLGGFSFKSWEVPNKIDSMGGYQSLVVHNFPGGDREVQKFGWFPPDVIRWSGVFTIDPELGSIDNRIQAIEDMAQLGNAVKLTFDRFSYTVVIWRFMVPPDLDVWFPYTIEVVPVEDNNRRPGPPQAPPPASNQQLMKLANDLGTAPGTPLIAPAIPNTNPPVISGPSIVPPGMPPSIPTAVPAATASQLTEFQDSLFKALENAQPGTAEIQNNRAALTAQSKALNLDLEDLISTGDTGLQAFATNTKATNDLINQQLNPSQEIMTQVRQTNPNLPSLAQAYYGDSEQWQRIAEANQYDDGRAIMVPNPRGTFNLTIPKVPM